MLIDSEKFDPNTVNMEDKTTTFGLMFYHANVENGYYINKGF